MSLRFHGLVDGRLPRALRAIRRLVALGFGERDIVHLIREFHRRRRQRVREHGRRTSVDRASRAAEARWAIWTMMMLGFNENEIADLAGVDHTTVSHALEPDAFRSVSPETATALKGAVQRAGVTRLKQLLPHVPIKVLDTCCDKGLAIDDTTRLNIALSIRTNIRNALILSSAPAEVVPGIHGFLAQVGEPVHGLFVFGAPLRRADTLENRLEHVSLLEHEAEHLVQRFRDERQQLEGQSRIRRSRFVPKDGNIA